MGIPKKPLVWWGMECPDWLYPRAALRGGAIERFVYSVATYDATA